jgi:putative lipoprotein
MDKYLKKMMDQLCHEDPKARRKAEKSFVSSGLRGNGNNNSAWLLILKKSISIVVFLGIIVVVSGCAPLSVEHDTHLGQDKALHFGVAAFIGAESSLIAGHYGASNTEASVVGISFALGMGALKELYDKRVRKTYWSWKDMFWNAMGGVIGGVAGAKYSTASEK